MKEIKDKVAEAVIDELGGLTKVAKICDIKPSSVFAWRISGLPKAQKNFLQTKYPTLKAWTKNHD